MSNWKLIETPSIFLSLYFNHYHVFHVVYYDNINSTYYFVLHHTIQKLPSKAYVRYLMLSKEVYNIDVMVDIYHSMNYQHAKQNLQGVH